MDERIHNGTQAHRFPGTLTAAIRERCSRAPEPEPVVPTDREIGPSLARRVLDIVVAVTVLSLVWPVFLVLAAATRLSTGGTAVYRQRRVGQGGVPFTLYKFQTMRARCGTSRLRSLPVTTGSPGSGRLACARPASMSCRRW